LARADSKKGENTMLPNIMMMNAMPSSISANPFPSQVVPQSETAGFNFNTYLLGLQTNATDGKLDIAALLQSQSQSNPVAEVGKQTNGTEVDSASGMGALAALFNVPGMISASIPGNVATPIPTNVVQTESLVGLESKNSNPMQQPVSAADVDWNAMGMTQVTPTEIQEQGWDMKKVEQLFANRDSDLKAAGELDLDVPTGPIKIVSQQLPTEKASAFQSEPLTQNQPVLQMQAPMADNTKSTHKDSTRGAELVSQVAPAIRETVEKRPGVESNVEASNENSLFSALVQNPSTSTTKVQPMVIASPEVTVASPSQQSIQPQEWVTRTESLAQQGGGKMTIALTPPELGKVEIEVITRGKNVEVEIRSETDGARKALESGMSDLKSALLGQDLVLSKSEVKVGAMERFHMDGFNDQNPNQTFNNPYTSQERKDSGNNSQSGFQNSNRWEMAQGKSIESNRSMASRYAPMNNGRLDVRI
jgi:flagellar hook-length control protein FliK